MPDLCDERFPAFIAYRIEPPVIPNTQPIDLSALRLPAVRRAWVLRQRIYGYYDPLPVILLNPVELLLGSEPDLVT
jgi:hypothetical protein